MQVNKTPSLLCYILDANIESDLAQLDGLQPYQVVQLAKGDQWIEAINRQLPEVAIIQADEMTEADFEHLRETRMLTKTLVIFVSTRLANAWLDNSMQIGASYHLRAPLDYQYLSELLLDSVPAINKNTPSRPAPGTNQLDQFGLLLGSAPSMRRLYRVISKAANSRSSVLLVGESGTGKELVAQSLHYLSPYSAKPFVAVNCGALSPELIESELFGHDKGSFTGADSKRQGLFAQAEGGTLFLDEITEMPVEQQVKLLRILETGEYRPVGSDTTKSADVRIIAATNRNPTEAISTQTIRQDLFFRIAHFPITIPPLRERGADIVGLAQYFLNCQGIKAGVTKTFTSDALQQLNQNHWPGNVRELKYLVERAYLLADDTITTDHLHSNVQMQAKDNLDLTFPPGMDLRELERLTILKSLADTQGNKKLSAQRLGISVKTLYNKLTQYNKAVLENIA